MANHIVEVHVKRVKQVADETVFNDVGIVIPARLGFNVEDGDTVEFRYPVDESDGADERITVLFPMDWNTDGDRFLDVTLNGSETRTSDQAAKGISGSMKFMVYCHSIGEFAVGDSPPDMNFHP